MPVVDLRTWPRRVHFTKYNAFEDPRFDMCVPVEVAPLHRALRERSLPLTAGIVYVITRAANEIPEFRYRIRGDTVVEHEVVHPSLTVLATGDLFSFCHVAYSQDFTAFAADFVTKSNAVKGTPVLADPPGRDDVLFMTALPWVSFTAFHHPMPTVPADSVPRFAWGKVTARGGEATMPLEVQGHHALMDGLHMARFYERAQAFLLEPEEFLG